MASAFEITITDEKFKELICDINTRLCKFDGDIKLPHYWKLKNDKKYQDEKEQLLKERYEAINNLNKMLHENPSLIMKLFENRCYNVIVLLHINNTIEHIGKEYIIYLKKNKKYCDIDLDDCFHSDILYVQAWKYACINCDDDVSLGTMLFNSIDYKRDKLKFIKLCILFNKPYMIGYTWRYFYTENESYYGLCDEDEEACSELYDKILATLLQFINNTKNDIVSRLIMYKEIQKYWNFDVKEFINTPVFDFTRRRLLMWKFSIKQIKKKYEFQLFS
jgi:hypothetical protein